MVLESTDVTIIQSEEACWEAVLRKDAACDGEFVYAVRTTGVYCRPSCPSRRPRRENTLFFSIPEAAEQSGFRACLRCRPGNVPVRDPQLDLVQRVCRLIEATPETESPLTLEGLGDAVGLSPFHLQRVFKRALGITPRQYAEEWRVRRLKESLRGGEKVTNALYDSGYNSSSTLYAGVQDHLGMTPSAYRRGGEHMRIGYAIVPCYLGNLLVAATERGVCAVRMGDSAGELEGILRREFHAASIHQDEEALGGWVREILAYLEGAQLNLDLPLDLKATAFQRRVWQELRAIPYGATRSYSRVAEAMGSPRAARAVATACASNPVALVIPCHRVVREDGSLGGYRWGIERKKALLEREAALSMGE